MIIDGQNINIDDLYSQKYMHKEIKKGIYLSDAQLDILSRYNIDINKIGSINELIFEIDSILEDDPDLDELEMLSREITEFNYYANTNK